MLTIRQEQFAVFSQVEVQKFEDWMVVHSHRFFRAQCTALGERQLRETIRYGIKRAAGYGIKIKRDVCKYIDLMIVFGRDFDKDPRYRWASEILGSPTEPPRKMRAAFQAAQLYLERR